MFKGRGKGKWFGHFWFLKESLEVVFSGTTSSWVCPRFIFIPKKFKFGKYWVWGNLSVHSLNYVNMIQWIKQFAKVTQRICRSVSLGSKNQWKVDKSGIRHVWIIVYPRKLNTPMKTRYHFMFAKDVLISISFWNSSAKYNLTYFFVIGDLVVRLSFLGSYHTLL